MGHVKRISVFEHAQKVQIHIILQMRAVSSGQLLSIETSIVSGDSVADSECPWLIWAIAPICLKTLFAWRGPYNNSSLSFKCNEG